MQNIINFIGALLRSDIIFYDFRMDIKVLYGSTKWHLIETLYTLLK